MIALMLFFAVYIITGIVIMVDYVKAVLDVLHRMNFRKSKYRARVLKLALTSPVELVGVWAYLVILLALGVVVIGSITFFK
jgi:hypothetical protein